MSKYFPLDPGAKSGKRDLAAADIGIGVVEVEKLGLSDGFFRLIL